MLSAPVVQWIERQPPKLEMWVRLPPGANLKSLAFAGLFIEAGSRQTALPVSEGEGRSDVFV